MRLPASLAYASICYGIAFSQPAPAPPTFEMADIDTSPRTHNPTVRGGLIRACQYELRTATLLDLIGRAYDIDTSRPGRGSDAQAAVTAQSTDPNGAIALGDALEKQLGLKLELRKHPMPVLVVDHIEAKPTEN